MPRGMRLRDYLAGMKGPPPKGSDIEDLMREVEAMDELDPEEVARLCRRGQARVWERIEEIMRREGRRGE